MTWPEAAFGIVLCLTLPLLLAALALYEWAIGRNEGDLPDPEERDTRPGT